MSEGLVGIYALYLFFVGLRGNGPQFVTAVSEDIKPFSAWVLAIVILRALYENETMRPMVKPFIGLAILTFTLKNFDQIKGQVNQVTGLNL